MNLDSQRATNALPKYSRSLWIEAPGRCLIRRDELPPPGSGDVLIRSLYSGVSRGTESLILAGKVPESEFGRMRGPRMEGSFPFPVKYGYATVGRVEEGEPALIGKTVFCLHPHQDLLIVAAEEVHLLPAEVPAHRAILAANMETALNIFWDAGIQPGDRVAVFGAGVVGCLVARLAARIPVTDVCLIDKNLQKSGIASSLDLSFHGADDIEGEFDILINASASAEALTTAISHAAMEAKIIEASWYGDKMVSIPLGGSFHSKRLSLISSQVGAIAASRSRRWTFKRRMAKALELLDDPLLDHLISGETEFGNLEDAYPRILSEPATLCHRILYP